MTVYVDPLKPVVKPSPGWRYSESCHMYADNLDELHQFARHIGLRRGWFQDHHIMPHYDLTRKRREAAVAQGALEVDSRHFIRLVRELN